MYTSNYVLQIIDYLNMNFRGIRKEAEEIEHDAQRTVQRKIDAIISLEQQAVNLTKNHYINDQEFIEAIHNFLKKYKNNEPIRRKVSEEFLENYVEDVTTSVVERLVTGLFLTYTNGISNRLDRLNMDNKIE